MNEATHKTPMDHYMEILSGDKPVSHTDFAATVISNRNVAINLSLKQVREMAAAILVLDHTIDDLTAKLATATTEAELKKSNPVIEVEPAPATEKIVRVAVAASTNSTFEKALAAMVTAKFKFDEQKFSSGENHARQKFERAALEVAKLCTPKTGSNYRNKAANPF